MAHSDSGQNQASLALAIEIQNEQGALHELTGIIARAGGDITWVAILDSQKLVESRIF